MVQEIDDGWRTLFVPSGTHYLWQSALLRRSWCEKGGTPCRLAYVDYGPSSLCDNPEAGQRVDSVQAKS